LEKVTMNNIINAKRWPLLFIKTVALTEDAKRSAKTIKYLLPQAGTVNLQLNYLINKHSNILDNMFNLKILYTVLTVSHLLFVIRRRIFRNYNIYNRLNSMIKRTRIDVGGLIYGN